MHEIICDEKGAPCDYRFLDINPAFERLTGLKRDDVVGKTYKEILQNDDPRWVSTYGAVALTGEPVQFENYSPELKRHYEVFAFSPTPSRFAVVFRDISERKQMEETLRKAHDELEARVQERTLQLSEAYENLQERGGGAQEDWKRSSSRYRNWKPWEPLRAASPTTSTMSLQA